MAQGYSAPINIRSPLRLRRKQGEIKKKKEIVGRRSKTSPFLEHDGEGPPRLAGRHISFRQKLFSWETLYDIWTRQLRKSCREELVSSRGHEDSQFKSRWFAQLAEEAAASIGRSRRGYRAQPTPFRIPETRVGARSRLRNTRYNSDSCRKSQLSARLANGNLCLAKPPETGITSASWFDTSKKKSAKTKRNWRKKKVIFRGSNTFFYSIGCIDGYNGSVRVKTFVYKAINSRRFKSIVCFVRCLHDALCKLHDFSYE